MVLGSGAWETLELELRAESLRAESVPRPLGASLLRAMGMPEDALATAQMDHCKSGILRVAMVHRSPDPPLVLHVSKIADPKTQASCSRLAESCCNPKAHFLVGRSTPT